MKNTSEVLREWCVILFGLYIIFEGDPISEEEFIYLFDGPVKRPEIILRHIIGIRPVSSSLVSLGSYTLDRQGVSMR